MLLKQPMRHLQLIKGQKMAQITIRIVQHEHKIDGDRYYAYLCQPMHQPIIVACDIQPDSYLQMCEKLDGLRFRLKELGNDVHTDTQFVADPNFPTNESAEEYIQNN